ncbi:uncharacterized protein LOC127287597 [Leptopilina boulardi]|uniref:uncharacterized protein LOC127287597 n=1 Tax=Leptopilina boulardi TaxID=63433 RepID=UPI0021F68BA1|nr:uncharacterized protein LOC127287597 [Leptopilina boulardi]
MFKNYNETNMESKIISNNCKENTKHRTIYQEDNKEKELWDNEISNEEESLCSNTISPLESKMTNEITRSLSMEFSSFSLYENNMLNTRIIPQRNIMKLYYKNEMELVSIRKKQCEFKRANKTFTIEELMKIDRENRILMQKILNIKTPQSKIKPHYLQKTYSCSAINRKKIQRKIEEDNMILLKKIQQARPHVIQYSNLKN